ncbi:tRNA synthetases class II core domain-containing protein [Hirsutella rhossiliensis]|uniref:Phenylalanine--tRNA ligase, mitochondrial n=1 Tax=Hirsutella rhossiliensis TaxID=111463 RepID=A0A9P8N3X7_9HYPO|nr:tRNA synthetases class II core domain-containing protein [Hirsutella rhossiliensis]KAH0966482.1 tRNA synthetases class II core domain-containing protein [Hirsutella rhossiliensis]
MLAQNSTSILELQSGQRCFTPRPETQPACQSGPKPSSVHIRGQTYDTDPSWFNVPPNVLEATSRQLHLQRDHPLAITRQLIESHFPPPTFKHYNEHSPVVSTHQNFDSLGFAANHPGRALTDTYYINQTTLLRTHTSAHQAETFRANESAGYLVSADVYRRDEIDRSHYPVFHQMEGARSWDRNTVPGGDIAAAVRRDMEMLPKHNIKVKDPNPPFHPERNPLQDGHSPDEAEAIGNHLKRSLENMVVDVFSRTKAAASRADPDFVDEPLRMRWVEAFFPFTSPSWELEVYYAGNWLEVLGSGVVKQDLYTNAGVPSQLGWAFGLGLERIAMLLFKIPDIRLFWSRDQRFLSQFDGVSDQPDILRRFVPFSKYPPCPRDVSFWLPAAAASSSAAGGNTKGALHENDVMELVRSTAGDVVEDVKLIDEFAHPQTGRKSVAYRIIYRSLERTLTNAEASRLHGRVRQTLVRELGVEIR